MILTTFSRSDGPASLVSGVFATCRRFVVFAAALAVAACSSGSSDQNNGGQVADVSVPNVVGVAQSDAESAVTGAGLRVGTVTTQSSNSVPLGNVISQSPAAGTLVNPTTAVNLVVSSGPASISVPDVVGLAQANADAAITSAGLVTGTVSTQASNSVPAGNVISQNPTAGTMVSGGADVDLVVSSGPANISVPDVVGLTQANAEAAITGAGLVTGTVSTQASNSVPAGNVISQNPTGGSMVSAGSSVDLVVSTGPANVTVPDVVGLTQANAEAAIISAGLVTGTVSTQSSNSVPAGNVISQSPVGGTSVSPGMPVDLIVSTGPANVSVPDVVGLTQANAEAAIVSAGLVTGTVSTQSSNSVPAGNVISQNPTGGSLVSSGSAVDLVVSSGAPSSFSDEFNANTLANWSLRHLVEGTAAQYNTLDINSTTAGNLTIEPTTASSWFANGDGVLVFKLLSGNFSVHTRVDADSLSSPGSAPAPGSNFNSAGLMARNPAGATGPENYVMLNIGRQRTNSSLPSGVGSETKNTVNSSSQLFLDEGVKVGELILCRVGSTIYSYRNLDNESSWTALDSFDRTDLPSTLQVGMIANADNGPADIRAKFDFIRLRPTPSTPADCTP